MTRAFLILLAALSLAACENGGPSSAASPMQSPAERAAVAEVPLQTLPADACWARDRIPAQTRAVLVETGNGTREARNQVLRPAQERLFAVPCPDVLTPDFTASLQRALAARGLYAGPITGQWSADTTAAVRRFQAPLGLDSGVLSLDAAQQMGLVAVPRDAW